MNLFELSDIAGAKIIVERYDNQGRRWSAQLEGAEIKNHKESGILAGSYGDGLNPQEAMEDYVKQIRGKHLVISAGSDLRREFGIPLTLEVGQ